MASPEAAPRPKNWKWWTKLHATEILTRINKAAQRVPKPKMTRIEQIASEVSAKIKLGTGPIWSGSGKCCAICAKLVGFSHPCLRNRLRPNQARNQRRPQSYWLGRVELSSEAFDPGALLTKVD